MIAGRVLLTKTKTDRVFARRVDHRQARVYSLQRRRVQRALQATSEDAQLLRPADQEARYYDEDPTRGL